MSLHQYHILHKCIDIFLIGKYIIHYAVEHCNICIHYIIAIYSWKLVIPQQSYQHPVVGLEA